MILRRLQPILCSEPAITEKVKELFMALFLALFMAVERKLMRMEWLMR